MWPSTLSGRLPVAALVGHYPTNKLIGRGLIPHRTRLSTMTPTPWSYVVLDPVSQAYPTVRGRSPTCYSPVRHSSTHHQRWQAFPFDLHVLSTPPAFVLSQDQTLQPQHTQTNACVVHKNKTKTIKIVFQACISLTRATHPHHHRVGVCDTHTTTIIVWVCVVLGTLLSSHTTKKRYCQRFSRCPLIFYVGLRVEE